MAIYGDSLLRPQPLDAQSGGSPARKSELLLDGQSLSPQKSGTSVSSSSVGFEESVSGVRCLQDQNSNQPNNTAPSKEISIAAQLADDDNDFPSHSPTAPLQPVDARIAQHNFSPHENQRDSFTYYNYSMTEPRKSRWKTFARLTAYPRSTHLQEKLVDQDWLNEHLGDYSEPWQGLNLNEKDPESGQALGSKQRKRRWVKRAQSKILRSPIVPLLIRLAVFVFSVVALALGGSIRRHATESHQPQGTSPDMAIIVDAVALVYLVYITYDEYTGKPLGLRPAKAKLKLIFLDLFFIVFASANLSLAFENLSNVQSACTTREADKILVPRNDILCERQKALASVLLIVLIAWLMTFAISALRVVERAAAK
ncbi:uncharacterized protein PADG_11388 [Paracoccidioides brasiliensis Pb18]|uniref:Regulator of phospholipase D SRF1 n=1 Tax=Paracoccidioides brasiliensis (strain Pb18) TaxID=502780 RepID=A0A0A0HTM6_PARBD|nr:uncharacterized protein PADG_11388 [Paracoccidioides brasiliensis Pb18]KGM92559.1 hypothetical protein PADG_11388 [Paracoccidioides brasiliensis Pb18]